MFTSRFNFHGGSAPVDVEIITVRRRFSEKITRKHDFSDFEKRGFGMKQGHMGDFYTLIPRQSVQTDEKEGILQNHKQLNKYAAALLCACGYEFDGHKLGTEQERILFLKPYFILKNKNAAKEGRSSILKLLLADQNLIFFSGNASYYAEIANKQYWIYMRRRKLTFYKSREEKTGWSRHWNRFPGGSHRAFLTGARRSVTLQSMRHASSCARFYTKISTSCSGYPRGGCGKKTGAYSVTARWITDAAART